MEMAKMAHGVIEVIYPIARLKECKQVPYFRLFQPGWLFFSPCQSNPYRLFTFSRMMNIVRAKGNKAKKNVFGGEKALVKHDLTVERLTTTAWECQRKAGKVVDPTAWYNASV
jgi:hypothetical protein